MPLAPALAIDVARRSAWEDSWERVESQSWMDGRGMRVSISPHARIQGSKFTQTGRAAALTLGCSLAGISSYAARRETRGHVGRPQRKAQDDAAAPGVVAVEEALRLPLPDLSWMDEPWPREVHGVDGRMNAVRRFVVDDHARPRNRRPKGLLRLPSTPVPLDGFPSGSRPRCY